MQKSSVNTIEIYFQWWLKEMIDSGYIKEYRREPETLIVAPVASYGRYKRFKRKEKEIEQFNLLPEIKYTYDYIVIWNESAEYLFYEEDSDSRIFSFGKPKFLAHRKLIDLNYETISYVDVKPTTAVQQRGGKVSSAISFPIKQRMLWDSHRIYINKVIPIPMAGTGHTIALFCTTFTPQRYLLTDGGGQRRKIKFPILSLKEFTTKKATYINNLLKNTK